MTSIGEKNLKDKADSGFIKTLKDDFDIHDHHVDADGIYTEIDIADMDFDEENERFTYECPCGDLFSLTLEDIQDNFEEIATCPSCPLKIRVKYNIDDFIITDDDTDSDS